MEEEVIVNHVTSEVSRELLISHESVEKHNANAVNTNEIISESAEQLTSDEKGTKDGQKILETTTSLIKETIFHTAATPPVVENQVTINERNPTSSNTEVIEESKNEVVQHHVDNYIVPGEGIQYHQVLADENMAANGLILEGKPTISEKIPHAEAVMMTMKKKSSQTRSSAEKHTTPTCSKVLICLGGTFGTFVLTVFIYTAYLMHDFLIGGVIFIVGAACFGIGFVMEVVHLAIDCVLGICRSPEQRAIARSNHELDGYYGRGCRNNGRYLMKRGIGKHPDGQCLCVIPTERPMVAQCFQDPHNPMCLTSILGGTLAGGMSKIGFMYLDIVASPAMAMQQTCQRSPKKVGDEEFEEEEEGVGDVEAQQRTKTCCEETTEVINTSTCVLGSKILFVRTPANIHPEFSSLAAVPPAPPVPAVAVADVYQQPSRESIYREGVKV